MSLFLGPFKAILYIAIAVGVFVSTEEGSQVATALTTMVVGIFVAMMTAFVGLLF